MFLQMTFGVLKEKKNTEREKKKNKNHITGRRIA